jgi:hypothetical protein
MDTGDFLFNGHRYVKEGPGSTEEKVKLNCLMKASRMTHGNVTKQNGERVAHKRVEKTFTGGSLVILLTRHDGKRAYVGVAQFATFGKPAHCLELSITAAETQSSSLTAPNWCSFCEQI